MEVDGELLVFSAEGEGNVTLRSRIERDWEDLYFERFCVLPYTNGTKFTMSERYCLEYPDGEVIISPVYDWRHERNPRYFWITCEEYGEFYITPLHNGPFVYLNGDRLDGATALRFGSSIRVVYGTVDIEFYFAKRSQVYKDREKDEVAGDPTMVEDVLRIIVNHNGLEEKKNWRLVNKRWDEIYAETVARSSVVNVNLACGPSNQLSQLLCDLKKGNLFRLKNLRICLPRLTFQDANEEALVLLHMRNVCDFLDSPLIQSLENFSCRFMTNKPGPNERLIERNINFKLNRDGRRVNVYYVAL